VGCHLATEVVLFMKLGENEVFIGQSSKLYFDISKYVLVIFNDFALILGLFREGQEWEE
jgi:hypothetical protein